MTLTGNTGTVRLPAGYIVEDLDLGYAQSSHATQGRTVDVALVLVDGPVDHASIYTPMTRGRHANHAYVVTDENRTARDVVAQALARDWIDRPAVAHRSEHDPLRRHQASRGIGVDMAKGERTGPREAYSPGTSTDWSRLANDPPHPGQPAGNSEEDDQVLRRLERLIAERERHSSALEARHRGTLRRGQGIGLGR